MAGDEPRREFAAPRLIEGKFIAPDNEVWQGIPMADTSKRNQLILQNREAWIRRLIDTSRRNNLLYLRRDSKGLLKLDPGNADLLGDLLAGERVLLSDWFEEDLFPQATARMTEISRTAKANEDERGLTTLFMALSAVTWASEDGGRPTDAPVILLAIRAERAQGGGRGWSLVRSGEPELNLSLLQVMRDKLKVDTKPIEAKFEQVMADGLLEVHEWKDFTRDLTELGSRIPGFAVDDAVFLGNFSFMKMALVQDLQEAGEALLGHDFVAALAGDPEAVESLRTREGGVISTEVDKVHPADDYTFLAADSSQASAIRNVLAGQDGIIQGPPGTGKSQTIANLIGEMVARGKRVLFVAEKRAAIQVVKDRLAQAGLGDVLLDLHGADIRRSEVVAQLQRGLENIRNARSVEMTTELDRLESQRRTLNAYVAVLHDHRTFGLSPYQAMEMALELVDLPAPNLRLRPRALSQLAGKGLQDAEDLLAEVAFRSELFLGTSPSPWVTARPLTPGLVTEILENTEELKALLDRFEKLMEPLAQRMNVRRPGSIADGTRLLGLAGRVEAFKRTYTPKVLGDRVLALSASLRPAGKGLAGRGVAWLTNGDYRAAIRQVRSIRRGDKATAPVMHQELLQACQLTQELWAYHTAFDLPESLLEIPGEPQHQLGRIEALCGFLNGAFDTVSLLTQPFGQARAWLGQLLDSAEDGIAMPRLQEVRSVFVDLDLDDFLNLLKGGAVQPQDWPRTLRNHWCHSVVFQNRTQIRELTNFQGRQHDRCVEEFRRIEGLRRDSAVARIRRAHGEMAVKAMNEHSEQATLIRREASKKRPRPLRKILQDAPEVLLSVFPCWMASPLSVSQLLGSEKPYFDLVLFDEASQIQPEDAISSILRAKRVVVAGDIHQLPPSPFFADGSVDGAEDEELAAQGYESLLQMVAGMLPGSERGEAGWFLEWHYRSKDESLIAFSNHHIYGDRMVTLPQPNLSNAVELVHVEPGRLADFAQESSGSEVERVVDLILKHAAETPDKSLGVIGLGINHARRIQAALDQRLDGRQDLAGFFQEGRKESFFVKNLERVQGDERDAIILSIGYGQDRTGTLSHNFGPINKEGGHRRLNVAVTRAREKMTTVASFRPEDLDPARTKGEGPKLLRRYLEFVASGGANLGDTGGTDVPENPFERSIREALEAEGMKLIPQYGASKYRLDLVVQHPEEPGRFVMAIECDGATYHSSASARDRDQLRQAHLEAMGWSFHRIWSTDWFLHRQEEVQRALDAYKKALERSAARKMAQVHVEAGGAPAAAGVANVQPLRKDRGPKPFIAPQENITQYPRQSLESLIRWIQSDGRLYTDDELVYEAARELGFQRVGIRIQEFLRRAIRDVKLRWGS